MRITANDVRTVFRQWADAYGFLHSVPGEIEGQVTLEHQRNGWKVTRTVRVGNQYGESEPFGSARLSTTEMYRALSFALDALHVATYVAKTLTRTENYNG